MKEITDYLRIHTKTPSRYKGFIANTYSNGFVDIDVILSNTKCVKDKECPISTNRGDECWIITY